jgi:hypothetical protein
MFEPINRKSPEDRRSVPLDPDSLPTILQGQLLTTDANDFAVLADGAAFVEDPMWAFTKTGRLDVDIANSVTVLEAPFMARVDTDGYTGTPAKGDALVPGTGGNVGKLAVLAVTTVDHLKSVVAYCQSPPDSDGVIVFKAIR